MSEPKPLWMVFDVESVGLHGEAFAVGWVVINKAGKELGFGQYGCTLSAALGGDDDRKWCVENVTHRINCISPTEVREEFWRAWMRWRDRACLAADVIWPVEARFLSACIDDDRYSRRWLGPYPLIDIAAIKVARGLDPTAVSERLPHELPAHNPLNDARQSARELAALLADVREPAE